MSNLNIKIAAPSDCSAINEFISVNFDDHEPIQTFHVRKGEVMDAPPEEFLRDCIETQTTLLAYDGEKLVGVLIAGEITSKEVDENLEFLNFGPKNVDVFKLLAYVDKKANICNRLKIPRCLHIHVLSVHLDHRRQGIAERLFAVCIEIGSHKDYPAFSIDCTSHYTMKLAEKFEMICQSTVTYDEYNEHIGKILFIASQPHTEIKSYAKFYEA